MLLTVEGERDDICAVGQTAAAHELCSGLRPYLKRHHMQAGAGHYGVFSGKRWRNQIYPLLKNVILASEEADGGWPPPPQHGRRPAEMAPILLSNDGNPTGQSETALPMRTIEAEPEPVAVDTGRAALVIIDMQRDFLEPGGFGAALGNDFRVSWPMSRHARMCS